MNINKIEVGDIFSEVSIFKVIGQSGSRVDFLHLNSGKEVMITTDYIKDHLVSGDQFDEVVRVHREDTYYTNKQVEDIIKSGKFKNELEVPKVGDLKQLGIKSIWNDIQSSDVFTVKYRKVDKVLSDKKVNELRDKQITEALEKLEKVKTAKKGVFEASKKILKELQLNPISEKENGEERVLRGRKKQMRSVDSFYDVYDLDKPETDNVRKVNVNTISEIIWKNIKYVVEK